MIIDRNFRNTQNFRTSHLYQIKYTQKLGNKFLGVLHAIKISIILFNNTSVNFYRKIKS